MKKEIKPRRKRRVSRRNFTLMRWAKSYDFADYVEEELAIKENPWDINELTALPGDFIVLIFAFHGTINVTADNKVYTLKSKQYIIYNTTGPFVSEITATSNSKNGIIVMDKTFFEWLHRDLYRYAKNPIKWDKVFYNTYSGKEYLLHDIYKLLQNSNEDVDATYPELKKDIIYTIVKAATFNLLEKFLDQSRKKSKQIYLEFLELLKTEDQIKQYTEYYADKLHVPHWSLLRMCQIYAGKTTKQMMADAIQERALKMLRESGFTVKKIALLLGFSSANSFNNFFFKHASMSPTEYRSKNKVNNPEE